MAALDFFLKLFNIFTGLFCSGTFLLNIQKIWPAFTYLLKEKDEKLSMENKKQLIIIPPMSEALKKLNEILEGVSEEENIEISIIDDLKELSQFLGSTGQCLILASNAKKCATLLQDNKAVLNKYHCKTILFTPKEIPAKTLIKFTKVGLTESILESSPPKTFLYKVKLLLRSIKTVKPQDEAEKTIKSLDAMKALSDEYDFETKDKDQNSSDENESDIDTAEKKSIEGETIDYDGNLKGKNKHQEESIDTNWKSETKKDSLILEAAEKNKNKNVDLLIDENVDEDKNKSGDADNLDMYYRGKQKKDTTNLIFENEDLYAKTKKLDKSEEIELEKKKSSYADIIDEGSMKQKHLNNEENATEEKKAKIEIVDLVLTVDKKKKSTLSEEESGMDLNYIENTQEQETEKKKRSSQTELELSLGLKGKIKNLEEEASSPELNEEMEYDNSEIERNKKKNIELELEAAKKEGLQNKEEDKKSDEGQNSDADRIDPNIIGKEGSVDKIETMMISINKPTRKTEEDNKEDSSLNLEIPIETPSEGLNLALDNPFEVTPSDDLNSDQMLNAEEAAKDNLAKSNTIELDLLAGEKLDKNQVEDTKKESTDRESSLQLHPIKDQKDRDPTAKEDDSELSLRNMNKNDSIAKNDGGHTHDGQVEKINTFYRSGDSKKTDQNWDNLNKKNDSIEILLTKSKREADVNLAKEKRDLGEITIDYRKLKEEFDMLESGHRASDQANHQDSVHDNKKDYDDAGSFKVIEVDPKSLDFSISIVNAIYEIDIRPKKIFTMLSDELVNNYHCFPIFYSYKLSDKKFNEIHNSFINASEEKKSLWDEFKKDTVMIEHFQTLSMTTWRCSTIQKDGQAWEDVELPTWAQQELKTKNVELIFPYFDGIDRMGMAIILFPDGLDSTKANGILTLLEMARTLFLDTIERYQVKPIATLIDDGKASSPEMIEEKKGVKKFFDGLFGKKKAG